MFLRATRFEDAGDGLAKWGFPKIGGTLLGVPIIRILVFWGLHWGPLILGNYQVSFFRILSPVKDMWIAEESYALMEI